MINDDNNMTIMKIDENRHHHIVIFTLSNTQGLERLRHNSIKVELMSSCTVNWKSQLKKSTKSSKDLSIEIETTLREFCKSFQ